MATIKQTFNVPNFLSNNIVTETELTADAASGQNQLTVLNTEGLADNDYLAISANNGISEIVQIQSISGLTITTVSNLTLNHKNHEKIKKLFGNQTQVYRAANVDGTIPDDTTFAALGSPVTIQPDQPYTQVTDSSGGDAYWYKFTYYNATSAAQTDLSEAEAVRGGGYGDYCSIQEIIDEAGLGDFHLDPSKLAQYRVEAQSEVKGAMSSAGYTMPLQTTSGTYYVPDMITGVTKRLAAGFALVRNYGTVKPGSAKDGKAKIDDARALIAMIQLNDVVLLDTNEQQLAKQNLVGGWPDNTTVLNSDTDDSSITMSMTKEF